MLSAPLEGWRHVKVADRHAKQDWAQVIKELVDGHFPEKQKMGLVMDNLNAHKPAHFMPHSSRKEREGLRIV